MSKRSSGSGGSSGESPGRSTSRTEPRPDGVSVTKYELCELEPTASSVAPLLREVCTRDRRSLRQLAISAGERCDDTYIIGPVEAVFGFGTPPDEPHAATRTVETSSRSLFRVESSASPAVRGNMGRGRSVVPCSATKPPVLSGDPHAARTAAAVTNAKAADTQYTCRVKARRTVW